MKKVERNMLYNIKALIFCMVGTKIAQASNPESHRTVSCPVLVRDPPALEPLKM
jgi:hypothetical protein